MKGSRKMDDDELRFYAGLFDTVPAMDDAELALYAELFDAPGE